MPGKKTWGPENREPTQGLEERTFQNDGEWLLNMAAMQLAWVELGGGTTVFMEQVQSSGERCH